MTFHVVKWYFSPLFEAADSFKNVFFSLLIGQLKPPFITP